MKLFPALPYNLEAVFAAAVGGQGSRSLSGLRSLLPAAAAKKQIQPQGFPLQSGLGNLGADWNNFPRYFIYIYKDNVAQKLQFNVRAACYNNNIIGKTPIQFYFKL